MKSIDILDALGKIDDSFVESAAVPKTTFYKRRWFKALGAMAACICILITGFYGFYIHDLNTARDLPMLNAYGIDLGAMGFEGVSVYDISETDGVNPWSKGSDIDTLPVYKNLAYDKRYSCQTYYNEQQLLEKVQKLAKALGEEIISTQTERDPEIAELIYSVIGYTESYTLVANGYGLTVYFNGAEFTEDEKAVDIDSTIDAAVSFLKKLPEEYKVDKIESEAAISYTFSGDLGLYFEAYQIGETLTESIINYNLNDIFFFPAKGGGLYSLTVVNRSDSTEKLGDYPIISVSRAKQELLTGHYVSSVPESELTDGRIRFSDIDKAELIYYTGNREEVYMPYYKFYVKLGEATDRMHEQDPTYPKGLTQYGIFYVPAVETKYLAGYKLFDGNFQ